MEPSGISINPPIRITWKGKVIFVGDARQALIENKVVFEERDEFLTLVYEQNSRLVTGLGTKSVRRLTFGDAAQYIKTLKKRWTSGLPCVDATEALRRTAICSQCPSRGFLSGCHGCADIAKMLMDTPVHETFTNDNCEICNCFLGVKVWLHADVIKADDREFEFPENCWVNEFK